MRPGDISGTWYSKDDISKPPSRNKGAERLIFLDGVAYHLECPQDYFEYVLPKIKADLGTMRDTQLDNSQKWFTRPELWKMWSVAGQDHVRVYDVPGPKPRIKEMFLKKEDSSEVIGLAYELGRQSEYGSTFTEKYWATREIDWFNPDFEVDGEEYEDENGNIAVRMPTTSSIAPLTELNYHEDYIVINYERELAPDTSPSLSQLMATESTFYDNGTTAVAEFGFESHNTITLEDGTVILDTYEADFMRRTATVIDLCESLAAWKHNLVGETFHILDQNRWDSVLALMVSDETDGIDWPKSRAWGAMIESKIRDGITFTGTLPYWNNITADYIDPILDETPCELREASPWLNDIANDISTNVTIKVAPDEDNPVGEFLIYEGEPINPSVTCSRIFYYNNRPIYIFVFYPQGGYSETAVTSPVTYYAVYKGEIYISDTFITDENIIPRLHEIYGNETKGIGQAVACKLMDDDERYVEYTMEDI